MAQGVEAVILSGTRRGEIIQLREDEIPEINEADLALLNAELDKVMAAVERLTAEYRIGTTMLKAQEPIN
jgi:hypothetical protein